MRHGVTYTALSSQLLEMMFITTVPNTQYLIQNWARVDSNVYCLMVPTYGVMYIVPNELSLALSQHGSCSRSLSARFLLSLSLSTVLDEFLDSVIHRRRVEGILQFRGVRGELVGNAAARGIPQKGDILVMRRRVGATRSAASLFGSPLGERTFTKKVRKPRFDPVV